MEGGLGQVIEGSGSAAFIGGNKNKARDLGKPFRSEAEMRKQRQVFLEPQRSSARI
jgi:hypothetical protein